MINYECDRCGAETTDSRDMWTLVLETMAKNSIHLFPVSARNGIWHVCRGCLKSFFQRSMTQEIKQ